MLCFRPIFKFLLIFELFFLRMWEIKVTLVVAVGALVLSLLAWLCSSEVFSFLLRPPGKKKREIMAGSI